MGIKWLFIYGLVNVEDLAREREITCNNIVSTASQPPEMGSVLLYNKIVIQMSVIQLAEEIKGDLSRSSEARGPYLQGLEGN